jgi:tRNA threonylcarbamoyladenosine biosynthesis protein TsaE
MSGSGAFVTVAVRCDDEAATDALGGALAGVIGPGCVVGLVGPLGAGKTRLVRAIAAALGVDPQAVSSPTFVLIHEYEGRLPVFHFDAYRLASPAQFEALGVADYWDAGGVCLVEWADRVAELLPAGAWSVVAAIESPGRHRYTITLPRDAADRLAARLAAVASLPGSGLALD